MVTRVAEVNDPVTEQWDAKLVRVRSIRHADGRDGRHVATLAWH